MPIVNPKQKYKVEVCLRHNKDTEFEYYLDFNVWAAIFAKNEFVEFLNKSAIRNEIRINSGFDVILLRNKEAVTLMMLSLPPELSRYLIVACDLSDSRTGNA